MEEVAAWQHDQSLAPLVQLMEAQQGRRQRFDDRLPRATYLGLEARLAESCLKAGSQPVVVRRGGKLLAFAIPSILSFPSDSDQLAFFVQRNGFAHELTLSNTSKTGPQESLIPLLNLLSSKWAAQHAPDAVLMWPSRDVDIEPTLRSVGFRLDSYTAFRLPDFQAQDVATPLNVQTRLAAPEDEDAIVALHLDVVAAHVPSSPFARVVETLSPRLRERLARTWAGDSAEAGAPIVLVAECKGHVVAMAECWLKIIESASDERLPPGRYGYINSFGVANSLRGSGIGRVLEHAVTRTLAELHIDGSYLIFSAYNVASQGFWSAMGYDPLWTTYQRRRSTGDT
jgi:ribosomal protein S18 acetylase RimI-like enzyme